MRLRRYDPSQPPPYLVALVGIIAVILLSAGRGESNPIGALALLVQGGVLIFVLRISDVGGRVGRVAIGATALLVVLGIASILIEGEAATASTEIVGLLFAVATPVAIIRRVIRESHVDATVVGGALCVYLLIGLFYVQVFSISDRVVDGQFFVQVTDPTTADYTYFSYVTMTTVGYGDLHRRGEPGSDVRRDRGADRSAVPRHGRGPGRLACPPRGATTVDRRGCPRRLRR